jgi:hypothetical protein
MAINLTLLVKSQESKVNGQESMVNGQESMVNGQESIVNRHLQNLIMPCPKPL